MRLLCSLVTVATSALLFRLNAFPSAADASEGVDHQYRVSMRVFFRVFCPACQWFVGDPLLELVRTEEYRNIIDLTLIPAAGMKEKQDGKITCEAGSLECTGHRWQACVLDKDGDDVVKYLGTIACIEGDESGRMGDWSTKLKNCVTDEERVLVKECFNHWSKDLLVKMIREQQSGSVRWMPYTLVNQKVLGSASEGVSLKMLKTSICSAYTGPKSFYPAECVKLVGAQKKFIAEDTVANKDKSPVAARGKSQDTVALAEEAVNTEVGPPAIIGGDGGIVAEIEEVVAPAPATGKVQMEMYWRAFCPSCMSFITKPLLSLIRNKEFQEIIDFHPVHAAGTSYDAKGNFVCTAGMVECSGHKWLSCAVEEFQQIGELVERIACMESKDNKGMTWSSIINQCFESEALTKMKTCYDTKSDELLRKNVVKGQALRVPWVPYVLLNGVPLGESTHGIGLKQLMDAVCKAYSGPQNSWPTLCHPKRLRDEAESELPAEEDVVKKPCAPKKKDADNTGAQYEDAPGIGKPLPREPEAKAVTELEAKVIGGKQVDDKEFSATIAAVMLPGVCFVGLVVVALRLTRDHKKDA